MRRAMLACLLSVAATTGQANDDWSWSGALGLTAGHLDYREKAGDGRRLSREHGTMPGIVAALRGQSADWSAGADLSYFAGDVRYDGLTNTNAALSTRTDQRIADGSAWLGLRGFENPTTRMDLYAGGGLRWWHRDIRSTTGAFGLEETYSWPYLLAGVRAQRQLAGGNGLSMDLRLLRPVGPELRVDFKSDYDNVDIDPDARAGGRLGLAWTTPWSGGRTVSVSFWYEQWRFDASDAELLRRNGAVVGTVHEPESKTEFMGLAVTWGGLSF